MLSFLSVLLIGLLALLLFRYAVWIDVREPRSGEPPEEPSSRGEARRFPRQPRSTLDLLPAAALVLAVAQGWAALRVSAFYALFSFPAYLVAAALFVVTVPRLAAGAAAPPRWRAARQVGGLAGLALVAFSALRLVQLHALRAAVPAMSRLRTEPTHADYAATSWPDAFTALCGKLAAEYPFTEWKRIDWRRQCSELAPRVTEAARRGDRKGYYRALRELAWSVPDGHVGLEGDDGGLERQETGGSFGLTLVELDPRPGEGRGRVVASRIEPGGPAARAGMLYGAELLAWSSTAPLAQGRDSAPEIKSPGRDPALPIRSPGRDPASPIKPPASLDAALSRVPLLWTESPPATAEARRLAQLRFLVRAPVGSRVTVTFRNRGSAAPAERTLAASPAGEEPRQFSPIRKLVFGCLVTSRTLPGGEGYLRVELELPTLPCPFPERAVRSALDGFAESGAAGVVLDVRGNGGGMDTMVPRIVAFFIPARRIYEIPGAYDRSPRRFVTLRDAAIWLVPRPPRYGGRVAVLVDEATVSSGEGFPLVLQGLPNVAIFGYRATAGFFAIGQKTVRLPGDLTMRFPQAQSLDAAGRIQVDSDASGRGGVAPDHRVPFDERALDASLRGGHDVVLEAAVRWIHGGRASAAISASTSSRSPGRAASAAGSTPSRRSSALVTAPIEAARTSARRRSQSAANREAKWRATRGLVKVTQPIGGTAKSSAARHAASAGRRLS